MKARMYRHIPGLAVGLSLGLLPLVANEAAAQIDVDAENCGIGIFCQSTDSESSGDDARGGHGGHGGNGGFATVHDIANAHADASSNVIVDDVTTGDAFGHNINVDATGADSPGCARDCRELLGHGRGCLRAWGQCAIRNDGR